VDAFRELWALVEAASEDRPGHSQRRSGHLHSRRGERVQRAESFDGADGAFVPDAHRFDARALFQDGHERNNPILEKVHLLDLLAGLMQQIAGEQQHLAQMGSKQGEIVRGEGGQKPVANMGILHGCHWLTPAIARGYSTMRTYRGTLADIRVRPAAGAVSILDFEMRIR